MEEQVRRLSAQYGWNLSDEEIRRIAAEAEVQEKVLDGLNGVDLGQTRPAMTVVKTRRARAGAGRKK